MSRPRPRLPVLMEEYPFGVLLVSLLLMIIGAPLTTQLGDKFPALRGEAAIAPLVLILTIAAAYAIWRTAKYRALVIFLGGFILAIMYLATVFRHHSLTATHLLGQVLFVGYVIAVVTRVVFRAPIVDGNILCGAASIYLLIGVMAGFVYSLVNLYNPGSFAIMPPGGAPPSVLEHVDAGWLIYFSFTTLTTVGFGDVLPASEIARSLAVLEAVIGQILLVVMMARLVGLHVAQVSSRNSQPLAFSTAESEHPPHPKRK